jgi:AcrR family transcriptional regulator
VNLAALAAFRSHTILFGMLDVMVDHQSSSAGRAAWLAEGLVLLAECGAQAVTLERLCERMGRSKGSFYHHFDSMGGFRTALFAHFENRGTGSIIERVEAAGMPDARAKLRRLLTEVLAAGDPEAEIAMRAWAKQDPEAEAVQRRIDAARSTYLYELCAEGGHPDPKRMGDLIYLVLIGAEHLTPSMAPTDLRDTYEVLFRLAWPAFGPLDEGAGES